MVENDNHEHINSAENDGCLRNMLYLCGRFNANDVSTTDRKAQAEELYLQGNVFRKQQQWAEALNAYEAAVALDSESPAAAAREMLMNIMEFYCKDYYNP